MDSWLTRVRGFLSVIVISGVVLFLSVIVIVIMLSMLFVPRNKVIGLRCSWSMYSDDVWKNTNVAAGYIIPICCCSTAANILSGNIGIYSFSFALLVSSILAIAYTYLVYRVKIADDFAKKPFLGNRFVDVLLIAATVVSVLLPLWLFSSQSAAFEHVGNKLIATHFNEKNQADGFMKASAFLRFSKKSNSGVLSPAFCFRSQRFGSQKAFSAGRCISWLSRLPRLGCRRWLV